MFSLLASAAAGIYVLVLMTWLFYIAIMHLRIVRHSLHPFAKANAYVLLAVGLVLDIAVNMTASLLFLELPKELLLTSRLERLKKNGNARQRRLAAWVCEHLLNQFDAGHC